MKKMIMGLLLTAAVFGLVACGGTSENQDSPTQTTVNEQDAGGVSGGNANTNTNPNTNEQSLPQEQFSGTVQTIEDMTITIRTSQAQHMVSDSSGTEQIFTSPGTATNEPQEIIIQLTEQTSIEVNEVRVATDGGHISDTRAGTVDDLTLQAFVLVEGEWQDDVFVATSVLII